MIQLIFAWIGTIAVTAILCMSFMGLVGYVMETACGLWDRWKWMHEEVTSRRVGGRILSESYWFSESKPAMYAQQAIGEALRDGDGIRISEARDTWRRKMAGEINGV